MSSENFRVGIIGGGIGGASAAYFIRQMFGSNVSITLFEQSGRIGGRILAERYNNKVHERGASIFHSSNHYLCDFAKTFNLPLKEMDHAERLIFYNGNRTTSFTTLGGPSFLASLRMAWRYGFDLYKVRRYVKNHVNTFCRIYELQAAGQCFTTPAGLLASLSPEFVQMTTKTHGEWLTKRVKLSKTFCSELAYGIASNNYNQNLDIHAFVGLITLAGLAGKFHAVENGNQQIPAALVQNALKDNPPDSPKAFVHANVLSIEGIQKSSTNDGNRYIVTYQRPGSKQTEHASFSHLILAIPLHQGSRIIPPKGISFPHNPYQQVHSTLLQGRLRTDQFGIQHDSFNAAQYLAMFPTQEGYMQDSTTLVRSVLSDSSLSNDQRVWSCFSNPDRVTDPVKQLPAYCLEPGTEHTPPSNVTWLAYPVYKPLRDPERELGNFVLAPGLFYANAIEQAASCMEIAVIGGRNVALLVAADRLSLGKSLPGKHPLPAVMVDPS